MNLDAWLLLLLAISLAVNIYLALKLGRKSHKQESYECRELLQDLLSGSALVKVQRIAPADLFLRSPRGEQ